MKSLLCIDGGGMRGAIPARVLTHFETLSGKPIAELFDFISGTSTGGILALGLVRPGADGKPAFTAAQLVELYLQEGQRIFHRSPAHVLATENGLGGPKYPADGIEAVLQQYFGDTQLHEALIPTLVTSYDTLRPGPAFFKSWNTPALMRDVARATSAAPTFFPPLKLGSSSFIDGGVFANNPAMCAWADAFELFREQKLTIVSLGTGNTEKREDPSGWGLVKWAPALIDIFMDGNSDAVDYQMGELADHYSRFQTDLNGVSQAMDDADPKTVASFIDLADKLMADRKEELDWLLPTLAKRNLL